MPPRERDLKWIAKNKRLSISIQQFDVNDYIQNRPMIIKLNEEKEVALTVAIEHEKELQENRTELEHCKRDIEILKLELLHAQEKSADLKRNALLKAVLSFIATLALGLGINLITSTLFSAYGLLFVFFAVTIHILIFYFLSSPKQREGN